MRFLALVVVLAAACTPFTTPSPAPPADWPASPEGACSNLERLGCGESKPALDGSSCPTVVRRAQSLRDMNLSCVATAGDLDALRLCGSVRCRD